jgi:hypothetical protein
VRLHECRVCEEQVNYFPDDTYRACRRDVAECNRTQWAPSKAAHDAWRDAQCAAEFRRPDFEELAARQDTA